ncbi:MAG TPA: hypothetical protein VHL80_08170 [Polyangia bacterium]|nr:hypothetical protein [Polyangia bacterium]
MSLVARRVKTLIASLALAAAGCGPTYLAVRPSEPLAAGTSRVRVDLTRLWLTEDVRDSGLDDDVDLVVELRVRNDDARPRQVSPGSFSCWMVLDAHRPGETRSLLPGGGGEGAFPGVPPGDGSMLLPVVVPPGQSRDLWAIFHGYRFDGSDRPRRVTLKIPLDDGELALDLADPGRGALRWEAPPAQSGIAAGLHGASMIGGGLRGTMPGVDIAFVWRRGPVMWNVGLISSALIQTEGPLQSGTSSFSGVGLQAHLSLPLLSWGASANPRQLGLYGGGTAQGLVEIETAAEMSMNLMTKTQARTYGLTTLEVGLELDLGALRFAPTPFPLAPDRRSLPRWSLRLGYVEGWAGGASGGGLVENLRFFF